MARAFRLHCTKLFLVIYNCIFVVAGAAVLALGVWLHFDNDIVTMLKIMEETPSEGHVTDTAAYITIGVGAFVMFVGFLGCCGACCESMCMLCLYTCLVFLVLAAEIICAILAGIFEEKIGQVTEAKMLHQVKHEYNKTNNASAITHMWDTLQIKLNCCGSTGPQDYLFSYFFNTTDGEVELPHYYRAYTISDPKVKEKGNRVYYEGIFVPLTCCLGHNHPKYPQGLDSDQCQIDAMLYPNNKDVHEVTALKILGCHEAIQHWVKSHMGQVLMLVLSVVALEILGLIIACCLMSSIRHEQSKYPWYLDDDDDDD